jgi:hypothetical protein
MSDEAKTSWFRKRIEFEDGLLNSRTSVFLIVNSLWLAAIGIGIDQNLRLGVVVFGLIVSLIWLICSLQSFLVIRGLTKVYLTLIKTGGTFYADDIVQNQLSRPKWIFVKNPNRLKGIRRTLKRIRLWLRPTNLLAVWLPGLFLIAWIGLLLWLMRPYIGN